MFVDAVLRRNPDLIEATFALHGAGAIPSNCYVIDVDAVAANAAEIADAATVRGLTCFQMTKQFGRNARVAQTVAENGIPKVVAVDADEARVLASAGLVIGHMGHLVQVPRRDLPMAVGLRPDVITVFGLEQAAGVASAATALGVTQAILLRVVGKGDIFYPAQEGGVPLDAVVAVAEAIGEMEGVRFEGVTSFPCLLWNAEDARIEATPNLRTLGDAVEHLAAVGIATSIVNAPSCSCVAIIDLVKSMGATQIEPGSALIGETPLHAVSDQPEVPAMVYVTEVTHSLGARVFTLGGGFYARSRAANALVRTRNGVARAKVELAPAEAIDYYGALLIDDPGTVRVGDSVVYAFRSQVFVTRARVAVVSDISTAPRVLGIFDRDGTRLGSDLLPDVRPRDPDER